VKSGEWPQDKDELWGAWKKAFELLITPCSSDLGVTAWLRCFLGEVHVWSEG
jgi:hypothetical protein